MSYDVELAKELKIRNNKDNIGIVVGIVIGVNPLKISIYGGEVLINEDSIYLCKNATEYTIKVTTATETGIATHEGLKTNDKVAVIATEDNQKFFIIDKIV